MTRPNVLPSLRSLKKLASWDGPFPMKNCHLIVGAERFGFSNDVITFLELFPRDEVFRNRDDFLNRCQALEALIRSERDMPTKNYISPQG